MWLDHIISNSGNKWTDDGVAEIVETTADKTSGGEMKLEHLLELGRVYKHQPKKSRTFRKAFIL